jgi:hypothetical protein
VLRDRGDDPLHESYFTFGRSLDQREEGLPFFDDVRSELRRVAAADVLCRVDGSGRDELDFAGEIDAHLDDLASMDAQIVLLEIGARDSWRLRARDLQRQRARHDQHRYRDDSSRFHGDLRSPFKR